MNVKLVRAIDKYILSVVCIILGFLSSISTSKTPIVGKVLVIKLWALGDSVISLVLIDALKKKFPKAHIDVLVHKRNSAVYMNNHNIDEVIIFSFGNILKLFRKYDVVFDTEPFLNVSAIIAFFSGGFRIGFANQIRSILYTKKVLFKRNQHMVINYLDMLKQIGIKYSADSLVPILETSSDRRTVDNILKKNGISKKDIVIGISPGVAESVKSRMWPKERFAELADRLIEKYNAKVIFVDGKQNEDIVKEIQGMMRNKSVSLAGRTSVGQLFYLIKRFRVFISNDTGPMHIAAAQGVKTIGMFGPNTPILWGPYGKANISLYKRVECSPCIVNEKGIMPECIYKNDKNKYQYCMKQIKVSDVVGAADRLLKSKK